MEELSQQCQICISREERSLLGGIFQTASVLAVFLLAETFPDTLLFPQYTADLISSTGLTLVYPAELDDEACCGDQAANAKRCAITSECECVETTGESQADQIARIGRLSSIGVPLPIVRQFLRQVRPATASGPAP